MVGINLFSIKIKLFNLMISIFLRLNEGFASWVENLGLNKTHPEWNNVSLRKNFLDINFL